MSDELVFRCPFCGQRCQVTRGEAANESVFIHGDLDGGEDVPACGPILDAGVDWGYVRRKDARMAHGIAIDTEGRLRMVEPKGLEDYQSLVGGFIEGVSVVSGIMYLNEEGKLLGLPRNDVATEMCRRAMSISPVDYIAGDVVVVGPTDVDGYEQDILGTTVRSAVLAGGMWP